jgi:hypothetical protein
MVPNKTIYVKDEDAEIWERAEKLAEDSVSALVARLLRQWVEDREALIDSAGMKRIIVEHHDDEDVIVRKAFKARILLEDFTSEYPEGTWDAGFANHNTWFAAIGAKGNFVVWTVSDGPAGEWFEVYESIADMESTESSPPADVIAAVAAAAGEDYAQELDV